MDAWKKTKNCTLEDLTEEFECWRDMQLLEPSRAMLNRAEAMWDRAYGDEDLMREVLEFLKEQDESSDN